MLRLADQVCSNLPAFDQNSTTEMQANWTKLDLALDSHSDQDCLFTHHRNRPFNTFAGTRIHCNFFIRVFFFLLLAVTQSVSKMLFSLFFYAARLASQNSKPQCRFLLQLLPTQISINYRSQDSVWVSALYPIG